MVRWEDGTTGGRNNGRTDRSIRPAILARARRVERELISFGSGFSRRLPLATTFRVPPEIHLVSYTMISQSIETCRSRAVSLRAA